MNITSTPKAVSELAAVFLAVHSGACSGGQAVQLRNCTGAKQRGRVLGAGKAGLSDKTTGSPQTAIWEWRRRTAL